MKKILSTVAISALLSTGAIAGDIYGSIGAAITTASGLDSGVSVVATGGMKLDRVFPGLAAEVEVSQTVVDPTISSWSDADISILGVGAYAVYNFKVPGNALVIKPRLGLNYQSWSYDYNGYYGYGRGSVDYTDTSLSYGIGATYPISNGLIVYADFTDKGDSNNIGAGVGMSF